jgi:hypothetical protein
VGKARESDSTASAWFRNALRGLAFDTRRMIDFAECSSPRQAQRLEGLAERFLVHADDASGIHGWPALWPDVLTVFGPLADDVAPAAESTSFAMLRRDVERFDGDVAFLECIERDGLRGTNDTLAKLLERWKSAENSLTQSAAVAERLNAVLRRAIFLVPHLASAVTLDVQLGDVHATNLADPSPPTRPGRVELFKLARGGAANTGETLTLHLPLPYVFTADTAEGRRRARRESWEDVRFLPRRLTGESALLRDGPRVQPPEHAAALRVRTALDRDVGLSRFAELATSEVRSVSLTAATDYLPVFLTTSAEDTPVPRPSPVMHFLAFRDFGDIGRNARLAAELGIGGLARHSLLEPSFESGLLDIAEDRAGRRQWLERGFGFLVTFERDGSPLLLRFDDVDVTLADTDTHHARHSPLHCALFRIALAESGAPRIPVTRIENGEICAELARHPVAPRRFRER